MDGHMCKHAMGRVVVVVWEGEGGAGEFPTQLHERSRNQSAEGAQRCKDQATVQKLRALRFRWPRLKTSLTAVSPPDSLN